MNHFSKLIPVVATTLFVPLCAANASEDYTITHLSSLGGATRAIGLNNLGEVVGQAYLPDGTYHAVLWRPNTGIVDLGTLPGHSLSTASSINDLGQVVGISNANSISPQHTFLWQGNAGMINIAQGTDWSHLFPFDIDNKGVVSGGSNVGGFIYSESAGITQPTIPGFFVGLVYARNEAGQMAMPNPTRGDNSFFYSPGQSPIEISFGTAYNNSVVLSMNTHGVIVGFSGRIDGGRQHGFIWDQINGYTDLTPGIDNGGFAEDINDLGQVVGIMNVLGEAAVPFLYHNGQWSNLYELLCTASEGWTDLYPRAINNHGQIAGHGLFNGELRAFLMSPLNMEAAPVPEPASLASLAAGAMFLLQRRRRTTRR